MYMLRMGIPLDGPASIVCNNEEAVVVLNSSIPESTLKKKHAVIACERHVQWGWSALPKEHV
jgi:hypothetical protein